MIDLQTAITLSIAVALGVVPLARSVAAWLLSVVRGDQDGN